MRQQLVPPCDIKGKRFEPDQTVGTFLYSLFGLPKDKRPLSVHETFKEKIIAQEKNCGRKSSADCMACEGIRVNDFFCPNITDHNLR